MFLICGEALFDLFAAQPTPNGSTAIDARPGGSPFNVAIGLARLQQPSALLTGISRDAFGDTLARILAAEGVTDSYLIRTKRKTTLSVVAVDAQGQPAYTFYGADSADCGIVRRDIARLGPDVTGLHFGSYSIVLPPVADAFADLAADAADLFISLDPNIRPTIEPDMKVWHQRIEKLIPMVNMVKISDEDIEALYGRRPIQDVAAKWLEMGPELIVVTRGAYPVQAFWKGGQLSVSPPVVDVVDTVGAGDTFQAVLLEMATKTIASGKTLSDMGGDDLSFWLLRAANAAAITCRRKGADLPSLQDLDQLI